MKLALFHSESNETPLFNCSNPLSCVYWLVALTSAKLWTAQHFFCLRFFSIELNVLWFCKGGKWFTKKEKKKNEHSPNTQVKRGVRSRLLVPSPQTLEQETRNDGPILKTCCCLAHSQWNSTFRTAIEADPLKSAFQILGCQSLSHFLIFVPFCPCAGLCTTDNKEVHNEMEWIQNIFPIFSIHSRKTTARQSDQKA